MWAGLILRLLPYLLAGGAVLGALLYVQHLRDAAQDAQARAMLAEQNAAAQAAAAAVLIEHRRRVELAAYEREHALGKLREQLRQSQAARVQARAQNPTYQQWADTRHPDAVRIGLQPDAAPAAGAAGDPDRAIGPSRVADSDP